MVAVDADEEVEVREDMVVVEDGIAVELEPDVASDERTAAVSIPGGSNTE